MSEGSETQMPQRAAESHGDGTGAAEGGSGRPGAENRSQDAAPIPRPAPIDVLDPRATIRQTGRWTYEVTTSLHELGGGHEYHVLGHRRAERLARRKLAKLIADHARHEQVTTIRPEDL